ncbi:MAG: hypothetical protein K1X74_10605 [Pirellulales bacterium]|nr:hypothetical protein [Pirellulales bacterium]
MTDDITSLTAGISIYQDIVLAGETVAAGERDCPARWALIEPYLPHSGTVLDVGSNFGWFALQTAQCRPEMLVASFEADERSAAVQYLVLASHHATRVALLTRTFRAGTLERLIAAGQRFDAVLLLSILHWLPDYASILQLLHRSAGHVFVEYPAADETGVGRPEVLRAIGPIEPCLRNAFPGRTLQSLGQVTGPRRLPRDLWHVAPSAAWHEPRPSRPDLAALLAERPIYPPRSWWQTQLGDQANTSRRTRRLLEAVPEAFRPGRASGLLGKARRGAGSWLRRCKMAVLPH